VKPGNSAKAVIKNWREVGEALRNRWRETALEGVRREAPVELLQSVPEPGPGMSWVIAWYDPKLDPNFIEALKKTTEDDKSSLAAYLTSDKPLGRRERERLARLLTKTRKTGRPPNVQLQAAASLAMMFYKEWRALNKKQGISDHGYCRDMKDYSAQWSVEDWFRWGADGERLTRTRIDEFATSVRELMEKPKHRRADAESGIITFPVFGWKSKTAKTHS
jgi:hypothetical protein